MLEIKLNGIAEFSGLMHHLIRLMRPEAPGNFIGFLYHLPKVISYSPNRIERSSLH